MPVVAVMVVSTRPLWLANGSLSVAVTLVVSSSVPVLVLVKMPDPLVTLPLAASAIA